MIKYNNTNQLNMGYWYPTQHGNTLHNTHAQETNKIQDTLRSLSDINASLKTPNETSP